MNDSEKENRIPINSQKTNLDDFEKLTRPLAQYLQKNFTPHDTVIVTSQYAKLVSDELCVQLKSSAKC